MFCCFWVPRSVAVGGTGCVRFFLAVPVGYYINRCTRPASYQGSSGADARYACRSPKGLWGASEAFKGME